MLNLVLAAAASFAGNPYASEQSAALADARKLGPAAVTTRYLSFAQVPAELRGEARRTINLWANSLSREAEFYRPRRVTETLVAVDVLAYGWDPQVWENLGAEDPYYHVLVAFKQGTAVGKRFFRQDGDSPAGMYTFDAKNDTRVVAFAPWLPAADALELAVRTNSVAPIVRADWWFSRAAIQFGRKGTGYYDWLAVKDRDEFDKLVGLNVKESQRVRREVAAIVARSGVADFPRQVFRFQSITGGYWQTRDVITDNRDARNPLRQLDGDYKHEAEEIYGVLPNGLFAFFLANDKGVRQDSAPDGIGFDKTAPGNDGKIHAGVSCCRCHVEGLRPVNDWGRRLYAAGLTLNSPDPAQYRRLVQLYLGELGEWYAGDNAMYALKLKRLTGWEPAAAAKAVGDLWKWYQEADLLPADLAAELGVPEREYLARLRAYYKANQLSDPVLASHIAEPPIPIRRDDVEQLYPIVAPVVLGVPPK